MYGALSDPNAVLSAIAEFDSIGREQFLEKYGYGKAREYVLLHNGKQYDSKAIIGVAFGYQHGKPLNGAQFNGGKNTVQKKLKSLGFVVASSAALNSSRLTEETSSKELWEGGTVEVHVNRYERSDTARAECISAHGTACSICEFDFADIYGIEFSGFIHVHHVVPLSHGTGKPRKVDPQKDLVPVCPNCHAIIHFGGTTRSIQMVKDLVRKTGG